MRHLVSVVGLAVLCLATGSCRQGTMTLPGLGRELKPISDRLREAYPQLSAGRFVRVADFELPAQARLFRVESAEPQPLCRITTLEAAPRTGGGSLVFRLNSEMDALVMDNRDAAGWSMPRNWRSADYPLRLLMMQLKSARAVDGLWVEIRDGNPRHSRFTVGPRRLRPGWNLIEADLDHAGQFIDLGDIQQLRLSVQPLPRPVELYLDDLVLADNGEVLQAASDAEGFELRSAGTHLEVILPGRYALVFRDGLIAQWYDLASDAERKVNLAGKDGLGPHVAADGVGEAAPAQPVAPALEGVDQEVVLLTTRRVEIAADRRTPAGTVHLTYALDTAGRVYWTARVEDQAGADFFPGEVVFRVNPEAGFDEAMEVLAPITMPADRQPSRGMLWDHSKANHADLLALTAKPAGAASPRAGLLVLAWPEGNLTPWARRMSADYARPARLACQTGWAVTTDAGDLDNDGFNETGGYYVVQMDEHLLRLVLDGSAGRRFRPSFKVVQAADKNCWAYVEGLLVREAVRTPEGDFVFTLPEDVHRAVEIEVNALAKEAAVGPLP